MIFGSVRKKGEVSGKCQEERRRNPRFLTLLTLLTLRIETNYKTILKTFQEISVRTQNSSRFRSFLRLPS